MSVRRKVDAIMGLLEGIHPPSRHTSPTGATRRRVPHLSDREWKDCGRKKGNNYFIVRTNEGKEVPLYHDDLMYIGDHHEYDLVWTKMTCTMNRIKNSVLAKKWKGDCLLYNVTPTRGEKSQTYYFMPLEQLDMYMSKWKKVDSQTLAQVTDAEGQDSQDPVQEDDTDLEQNGAGASGISTRQPSNLPSRLHRDSDQFEDVSPTISVTNLSEISQSILEQDDENHPFVRTLKDEAQSAAQQLHFSLNRAINMPTDHNNGRRPFFQFPEPDGGETSMSQYVPSQVPANGGGEATAQSINNPATPPPCLTGISAPTAESPIK